MLKNVIENYLTAIREVEFFGPFKCLLECLGYYDIHLLHGSTEFGKDFIAKKKIDDVEYQYYFQLKAGDINYNKFTTEIKPQLLEIITNKISHPNFNKEMESEVYFVTTGVLKQPATISFQEFNNFAQDKLNVPRILIWEKDDLIEKFYSVGIEPFFEVHKSPEFVNKFFDLYAKIKNDLIPTSYEIVSYTDSWFSLDLTNNTERLQVWFEGYFFAKLLFEKKFFYESILFLSALIRLLGKFNKLENESLFIIEAINENITKFSEEITSQININKEDALFGGGMFSIFTYPENCLKIMELICIQKILFEDVPVSSINLFEIILKEKGSYRIISENFSISVFLISITLLNENRVNELKKYLTNVVVWICDRYEQNGLVPLGYTKQEEYEQLLSEHLSGLNYIKRNASFCASIILDICIFLNDSEFYSIIANDFRAVEIIPEFHHVNNENELYDYKEIVSQSDYKFKLELDKNFASFVAHRDRQFSIEKSNVELILLTFLLRDRYFPNHFLENRN